MQRECEAQDQGVHQEVHAEVWRRVQAQGGHGRVLTCEGHRCPGCLCSGEAHICLPTTSFLYDLDSLNREVISYLCLLVALLPKMLSGPRGVLLNNPRL